VNSREENKLTGKKRPNFQGEFEWFFPLSGHSSLLGKVTLVPLREEERFWLEVNLVTSDSRRLRQVIHCEQFSGDKEDALKQGVAYLRNYLEGDFDSK